MGGMLAEYFLVFRHSDFGFCDAYQFSRMFKRKYGYPPSHFKARDPSVNINLPPL